MFDAATSSMGYLRSGQLRPLGVTSATRLDVLPDVPAIDEFVPGYEAMGWQGIGAPRDTPADIVDKLNGAINASLADPKFKAKIAELGGVPLTGPAEDFGKIIVSETDKWAKVVQFAGARVD